MWNILNPKLKERTVVVYDYLVAGGSQNYVTLTTVPDFSADGDGNDDDVYDAEYVNYDWMNELQKYQDGHLNGLFDI
jgi:hypothetical protein